MFPKNDVLNLSSLSATNYPSEDYLACIKSGCSIELETSFTKTRLKDQKTSFCCCDLNFGIIVLLK